MFKVILYDANCSPICDRVAYFFTEDLEDFKKNYLVSELHDEDSYNRLLRSEKGEIVTDYYSDDPKLNIVTEAPTEIIHEKNYSLEDIKFDATNAYGCAETYLVDKLDIKVLWLKFNDEFWVTFGYEASGLSLYRKMYLDEEEGTFLFPVKCWGNPVFKEEMPYTSTKGLAISERDKFKDNKIATYCYTASLWLEDSERLEKHYKTFEITEDVLDDLFQDVIGEAG